MKTVLVTIAFSAMTTSVMFAADTPSAIVQAACGSSKVIFNAKKQKEAQPALQPSGDKAAVYVISRLIYTETIPGCQVVTRIGLDGKWVGANCGTSYLSTSVSPGEHHLCGDWQSKIFLGSRPDPYLSNFTAEAGKSYYFILRVSNSKGISDLVLEPTNSDEGKFLIESVAASVSNPK